MPSNINYYDGKVGITPSDLVWGTENISPNQTDFWRIFFSQKFDVYDDYKQNELIVEMEAIRARIPNKQLKEKIKNIVQKAKQIPL